MLPLTGRVVTGDARYCQCMLCPQIQGAGGDSLFVVKGNHPALLDAITVLFATAPPGERCAATTRRGQHGGRQEVRRLSASASLVGYLDWPRIRQVGTGERRWEHKGGAHTGTRAFVTSLPVTSAPRRLLKVVRGH